MKTTKFLIVANGPFLPSSLIKAAAEGACIVALDGAANQLLRLNILPDMILGDFDSFCEEPALSSVKKIKLFDQNFTDFQKALTFIKQEARLVHVVCATGGRMDHEQANIRTLIREYSSHCPIYLHNAYQVVEFVRDKTVHIQGKPHDFCGFFGMPQARMIVKNQGLAWGSDVPYEMTLTQFSSSNRLRGDTGAVVEIIGDALIVHPPMFDTQGEA